MAKKKALLTDEEIYKLISEEVSANEIKTKSGISIGRLRIMAYKLSIKDKKVYDLPGLFDGRGGKSILYSGTGINISKTKLKDSEFSRGDKFNLVFEEDKIILTKI